MRGYVRNVLVSLDQLLNAITGGDEDECVSSRLGKARRGDYGSFVKQITAPLRWTVDFIARVFFRQTDHCRKSIEEDEGAHDLLRK